MLLKRLFIGLLILSALTAEGMAVFNTALFPLQNYMAGLCGEVDEADVKPAGGLAGDICSNAVRYKISAFIPLEEILQSRDNPDGSFGFPYSYTASEPDVFYSMALFQAAGVGIIDIPLNGSDISPPSPGTAAKTAVSIPGRIAL